MIGASVQDLYLQDMLWIPEINLILVDLLNKRHIALILMLLFFWAFEAPCKQATWFL
jgi:hypothetical protein